MRKGLALAGLALLVLGFSACNALLPYSDTTLTGSIDGNAFTFVDGYIDSTGSVKMYAEAHDLSTQTIDTYPLIMFSVPTIEPAEYVLSFKLTDLENSYTATFVSPDITNYIIVEGNIEITEVTTTTVSGRMHIRAGSDDLDGTFVLERVSW